MVREVFQCGRSRWRGIAALVGLTRHAGQRRGHGGASRAHISKNGNKRVRWMPVAAADVAWFCVPAETAPEPMVLRRVGEGKGTLRR